jgi:hypothetical protein
LKWQKILVFILTDKQSAFILKLVNCPEDYVSVLSAMKAFYTFILSLLFINCVNAQHFDWSIREGLWEYDFGYGIANDNAGNVYVAGKYEENANFSGTILPNAGSHEIWVAKYTASGVLTWIRTGGGAMGDYAHALACDGSNYLYVAGEIEGTGPITFPGSSITLSGGAGDNDIFVNKYNLNGTLLWARRVGGGPGSDKALGVSYDHAGNIYLCGNYYDTTSITFGGSTIVNGFGKRDIFIAKYDANGNFKWVRTAGSPKDDEAKAMVSDQAGNSYVCGYYHNGAKFGSTTLTIPDSNSNIYIAKYDNAGNLKWLRTAGGINNDRAWGITLDNTGKLYVTGEYGSNATFDSKHLTSSDTADIFIASYDTTGTILWVKGAGGNLVDRARGIGSDGSNVYITGQFGASASFDSITLNAVDSSDIFMACLTNNGNFRWAVSVGGIPDSIDTPGWGFESGTAICAEPSGNVYATGAMFQGGIFGTTPPLSPYDRTDVFITKISSLTGINSLKDDVEMILYPVPNSGHFTLEIPRLSFKKTEVIISNALGQKVFQKNCQANSSMDLDLSSQPKGVYFIEMKADDKSVAMKKFIIQ